MKEDDYQELNVFEIQDYTTVSDFERLIARFEECLVKWHVDKGKYSVTDDISSGKWQEETETCQIGEVNLTISHYFLTDSCLVPKTSVSARPHAMASMFNLNNDFPSSSPLISHWFGLTEFILVGLTRSALRNDTNNCDYLLSIVAIALNNTSCQIPVFVQHQAAWRNLYTGVCLGGGFRTTFNSCHLNARRMKTIYKSLEGIYDIFEEKLGLRFKLNPMFTVVARYTYMKKDFNWNCLKNEKSSFPFGTFYDPISNVHLCCKWSFSSDRGLFENEEKEFIPSSSSSWSVGVSFVRQHSALMGTTLAKICNLRCSAFGYNELNAEAESAGISNTYGDVIKNGMNYFLSLTSVLRSKVSSADGSVQGLINKYSIDDLFHEESYVNTAVFADGTENVNKIKSAPLGSILFKLCSVISNALSDNELSILPTVVIVIWSQFITELSMCWKNKVIIPSVDTKPNHSFCILHQKLQLFNFIIDSTLDSSLNDVDESAENEERFYDCSSDIAASRLYKCGELKSCVDGAALYAPVLQKCLPVTEDMMDQLILVKISKEDGSCEQQVHVQTDFIRSCMAGFKAANPNACFQDFTNYYFAEYFVHGTVEGSAFCTVKVTCDDLKNLWNSTRPLAAYAQKPLFNGNACIDSLLNYFSSFDVGKIMRMCLPVFLHAALIRLVEADYTSGETFDFASLTACIEEVSLQKDEINEEKLNLILNVVNDVETKILRRLSLRDKFLLNSNPGTENIDKVRESTDLLDALMTLEDVPLKSGISHPLASNVSSLFIDKIKNKWPDPHGREYILRASSSLPTPLSRTSPQRLYCMLSESEFRLCGAFTEDTIIS